MSDHDDIEAMMDLEGRLRFHADAFAKATWNEAVPGTFYAEGWREDADSRKEVVRTACSVLENVPADEVGEDLAERMAETAAAIRSAIEGRDLPGHSQVGDWTDKPHRVLNEAVDLMIEAADAIAAKGSAA